jgi:2-isopropylmalate synthase
MLCDTIGVPVQPNKAVIGRNAFAHAAGIHQDGMIKNPLTYEIITPQSVGVPDSTLVLGKHSGRHALAQRFEKLGYQFDRRDLDEIYRRFVLLADKIKRVEDHHLRELARGMQPGQKADDGTAAQAGKAIRVPVAADPVVVSAQRPNHEHHGEQEDYLWGV